MSCEANQEQEDGSTKGNVKDQLSQDSLQALKIIQRYDTQFFDFVIGLYAQIPLVRDGPRVKVHDTLTKIPDIRYRDMLFTRADVHAYFMFFRYIPWSLISTKSASKGVEINLAVPLLPYAHRLYHDVPYSAWRHQIDKGILSRMYYTCNMLDLLEKPDDSEWDIHKYRVWMVTQNDGVQKPFNSYKCRAVSKKSFDNLPMLYKMMVAQIWIFNAQCRNKNMVLDWWDWDNVPEALDTISPISQPDPKPQKVKRVVKPLSADELPF